MVVRAIEHYGRNIRRYFGGVPKCFVEVLALELAENVGRDNQSTNALNAIFICILRE